MATKTRKKRGEPNPAILADIVSRIVEAANPEKIVLFGSAARGTMGPHSDYDFLVIKGGKFNRHRVTVATPEEVELYRDNHCMVICPATREGRVVYGA